MENVKVITVSSLSELMNLVEGIDVTQREEVGQIEMMIAKLEKSAEGLNVTIKEKIENLRYNVIIYTLRNLKKVDGGEMTNAHESKFVQRVVAFYLKMTSQPKEADLKLKHIRRACFAQLSANNLNNNNPNNRWSRYNNNNNNNTGTSSSSNNYKNKYRPFSNSFGHKILSNFDAEKVDSDLSKVINAIVISHLGINETKLNNFRKIFAKHDMNNVTYEEFVSLMWLVVTQFETGLFETRPYMNHSLGDKYGKVFTELVEKSRGLYQIPATSSDTRFTIAVKMFQRPKKVIQKPALIFGYICNWIIIHLVRIHSIMIALNEVDVGDREKRIFNNKDLISNILGSIKGKNTNNIFSNDILNLFVRGGTKYPEGSIWDKIINSKQSENEKLFSNYKKHLKINQPGNLRQFSRYLMSPGLYNVPGN